VPFATSTLPPCAAPASRPSPSAPALRSLVAGLALALGGGGSVLAAATAPPASAAAHATAAASAPVAAPRSAPVSPSDRAEAARLHALLDAQWQWLMQANPEFATRVGDHRYDDRLTDASPAALDRREAHEREWLAQLRGLHPRRLQGEDRISYDFALERAQLAVDWQRFPAKRTRVISAMDGVQLGLPALMRDTPIRSEADARHALARLAAMPTRIAQDIALAREGNRLHWVTFRASLAEVPKEIDGLLARPLPQSPLFDPFTRLPADLPAERRDALRAEAEALLRDQVFPAYRTLRQVIVDELLPASPENGAMSAYPDGAAFYALAMREQTTLVLDPKQVHELGLAEMARIHGEIAGVMRELGFTGSFAEFVEHMNHDPQYFYTSADEMLAGYRDIAKRVDPQLPGLFLTLPRTPYGIRAIPAYQGANATEFYTAGAVDASSPGWFNANVSALVSRPKWNMEALFLHEGVPGHHLQISRAHELDALPMFRRSAFPNAYVEGWALYAESLGQELGLYADPAARYGKLHMEAFRAARLVVDTGIHALGWTRDQAIDYMVTQVGQAREDAVEEVDRYYVWPGQALGYKLGQLKILELRKRAQAELGPRFDLRAFHQEVLDHGALPLPVLEQVIDGWIARTRAAAG
jgi:uncharacterized protein (DUF885 family)